MALTVSDNSRIEWTEATWNPVTGCTKVSPGCKHCYAERLAKRLKAMGSPRYRNGFRVTLREDVVGLPLRWRSGRRIFVNSMSDLFHEAVPFEFTTRCFEVMRRADQHSYQVLTKRPQRMLEYARTALPFPWPAQVWAGTSVESQDYSERIDTLRHVPATVRFLSLEPLLGPFENLDLRGMSWIIVGGESGPRARPMDPAWVRAIRDQCREQRVPFFFKQWGGSNKKASGRTLEGRTWDEYPLSTPAARPSGRAQAAV